MHRFLFSLLVVALLVTTAAAQKSQSGFSGNWNWAIYAKDKSELPPAYQSMELNEVPAYALDLTLRRKGNRLTGSFGLVARYLARVDEGDFTTTITGNTAVLKLKSNFGGSATVRLRLSGNNLSWKVIRSRGENFFPNDATLRKLKPGEKPPYVANDDDDEPPNSAFRVQPLEAPAKLPGSLTQYRERSDRNYLEICDGEIVPVATLPVLT
jgi:hypothetical protein